MLLNFYSPNCTRAWPYPNIFPAVWLCIIEVPAKHPGHLNRYFCGTVKLFPVQTSAGNAVIKILIDIFVNNVNLFAVIISLRALNFYLIKAFEPVFKLRTNCTKKKGNSIKNYLFCWVTRIRT